MKLPTGLKFKPVPETRSTLGRIQETGLRDRLTGFELAG